MIDKTFWAKVAGEWKKADDGIDVPDIGPIGPIDPDPDDPIDIDDILADFDLDI